MCPRPATPPAAEAVPAAPPARSQTHTYLDSSDPSPARQSEARVAQCREPPRTKSLGDPPTTIAAPRLIDAANPTSSLPTRQRCQAQVKITTVPARSPGT